MAEKMLKDASYGNLVIGAESLDVDARNQKLCIDSTESELATHANLGVIDVDNVHIDQSGADVELRGGDGKDTAINRIEGAKRVDLIQDNMSSRIQASGSGVTAVNHITNSSNFTHKMRNSTITIDGSSQAGRKAGGITAHTIVDGNSDVTIVHKNCNVVIYGD